MRNLPTAQSNLLLTSWDKGEDAALWEIDRDRLGILTVDFITPVEDDPYRFGEIAAANSLSDVFAMGGRPLVALNVVGFPSSCAAMQILQDILSGGAAKIIESGAVLGGGHTVQDNEPKYGLVVFGEVERGKEWRTEGARPGDALIITKPLGSGIAVTAIKGGLIPPNTAAEISDVMAMLNDIRRADISNDLRSAIHACTDVTGFGLAGHALDMLPQHLNLSIFTDALPVFPQVAELAQMGLIPAGSYANRAHAERRISNEAPTDRMRTFATDIAFDPQTSGGLLMAVEWDAAKELAERLLPLFPSTTVIGEFSKGNGTLRLI